MALSVQGHAQSPDHSKATALQTATGQYVTPTALRAAVQQFLNPRLPTYPDFVAGEAVRSQISPDGKTLAILCAWCECQAEARRRVLGEGHRGL